jgi:hypothetical protein
MAVRWTGWLIAAWTGAVVLPPSPVAAQRVAVPLEARVWLDRGAEPVLRRGESARLYYRASRNAFLSIFQIDTNGSVRMVFPRSPEDDNLVRGGVDYRLLFARSSFWQVDEDPGVGYFFVVASPLPLAFSAFRYSYFERGWDVSHVAREVYRDPYVAMDEYVAALIPDWEEVPYALDFLTYHVGRGYEYPRFLCYNCHGFRPYSAWNPYAFGCSDFRVMIFNDPYYYPATRYRGDRVVYVRPPQPFEPRFAFKERTAGEPTTPLRLAAERRSTAGIGSGGMPGGRVPSTGGAEGGAPRRGAGAAPATGGGATPLQGLPNAAGGATGAPSGRIPASTDERPRPALQPRPSVGPGPSRRPVQPGGSSTTPQRPQAQPAPTTPPAARPDTRPQPATSGGSSQPNVRPQPANPSAGAPPPPVSGATRPPPGR